MSERWQVQVMSKNGFFVDRESIVHHWTEDADGNRVVRLEWLCDSPVRDIFPGWVWDTTMDPRG